MTCMRTFRSLDGAQGRVLLEVSFRCVGHRGPARAPGRGGQPSSSQLSLASLAPSLARRSRSTVLPLAARQTLLGISDGPRALALSTFHLRMISEPSPTRGVRNEQPHMEAQWDTQKAQTADASRRTDAGSPQQPPHRYPTDSNLARSNGEW